MQLYPNRFNQHLQKQLDRFYLIFGDEPQQKLDALQALRSTAGHSGFDERHSLLADNQFNWQQLVEATQSLSLFSSKQFIEVELPTGKPGSEGAKVLSELASHPNQDTIIVLHGGKIGKDVQNTKWFKALDKQGVYVPCYPLEGNQLHQWLVQYARQESVSCRPDALKLLADFNEGNLMAARQEIDKLKLLYPDGEISIEQMEQAVVDQSRYNVFQLVDVLLSGDAQKVIKMLYRLETEGVEPTIILWALAREWQTLSHLKFAQRQHQNINWNQLRIWKNKQSLYLGALQRLTDQQLDSIRDKLHVMDQRIKQSSVSRPYVELGHLCLLFVPFDLEKLPLTL